MSVNSIGAYNSYNNSYSTNPLAGTYEGNNRESVFSSQNTSGLTEINTGNIGSKTYYKENSDGTYTIYTQPVVATAPEPEEYETLSAEEFKEKYPQANICYLA